MPRFLRIFFASLSTAAALIVLPSSVSGQTIWSGLTRTFAKAALSDGTLPQNQDHLTDNVVLTRLASGGMVNVVGESFFSPSSSPSGTRWATDLNNPAQSIAATNWQNLSFTDWIDAYGGSHSAGGSIAGRDAVVYLMTDNVYLDLKFTTWTSGAGGGYSYMRAVPPIGLTPTGDYNLNGVVDAADYVVWRDTLTQSVSPTGSGADGNANGTVDSGDLDFWRAHFGNILAGSATESSLSAESVPEPASWALVLSALLVLRGISRASR